MRTQFAMAVVSTGLLLVNVASAQRMLLRPGWVPTTGIVSSSTSKLYVPAGMGLLQHGVSVNISITLPHANLTSAVAPIGQVSLSKGVVGRTANMQSHFSFRHITRQTSQKRFNDIDRLAENRWSVWRARFLPLLAETRDPSRTVTLRTKTSNSRRARQAAGVRTLLAAEQSKSTSEPNIPTLQVAATNR